MVRVQPVQRQGPRPWVRPCVCVILLIVPTYLLTSYPTRVDTNEDKSRPNTNLRPLKALDAPDVVSPHVIVNQSNKNLIQKNVGSNSQHQQDDVGTCPYMSLSDLSNDERHPKLDHRHMVTPPPGGKLTLVCCQTTKGPWSILVHSIWAPLGAERFLQMVESGYFQERVPLFRCVQNFLCQFGLSSNPALTKQYRAGLQDDKQWLPQGPKFRFRKDNSGNQVKRFAKGYFAYAGSGPNTRSNQFFVALKGSGPLGGGSPWEVPWGELVGTHSYDTLSRIYTGYGEKGPSQGLLHRKGITEEVEADFPELDYITSCRVVDEVVED